MRHRLSELSYGLNGLVTEIFSTPPTPHWGMAPFALRWVSYADNATKIVCVGGRGSAPDSAEWAYNAAQTP